MTEVYFCKLCCFHVNFEELLIIVESLFLASFLLLCSVCEYFLPVCFKLTLTLYVNYQLTEKY